ncbi:MAG: alpha/beta hydrolase [Sphingomonadales bacterium]|nr:alpha/beta hydrolase [Sphingomonadales bacterium]
MFDRFAALAAAYNLSERQLGLLRTLRDAGGIREAAGMLGISYTSARNMVAELKAKLGVATVPMMIGLAGELTPDDEAPDPADLPSRHDLFALSDRQYAIAAKVSTAKSRKEIAETLGVSEAVVDAEMKEIYLILGIGSAGELIRVIAEVNRDAEGATEDKRHDLPLGLAPCGQRTIGYSDYGPAEGRPVVILHSTITSRAPPTRLVAALQMAGFRPLAIDRPGFGSTSDAEANGDPFAAAAHDTAALCRHLDLAEIDVIARGSGQAAMRLAQQYPKLVRRAVLVNPTPAITHTTIDRGPLGAVKRAYAKRPWAVEVMIRLLSSYTRPSRMRDGMRRAFRESPPDFELIDNDPQFVADYLRAVRGFAQGRIAGYVAEQSAWAKGLDVPALPGMTHWRIVQGRHFVMHHPEQAMAYWRVRLPDTPIRWVDEAGQLLAYSHPDAVVAALRE